MEAYYVEGVLEKAAYIHPSTTMPTCTYVGTCRIFYFVFALGTYVRMRAHDAAILPMRGRGGEHTPKKNKNQESDSSSQAPNLPSLVKTHTQVHVLYVPTT